MAGSRCDQPTSRRPRRPHPQRQQIQIDQKPDAAAESQIGQMLFKRARFWNFVALIQQQFDVGVDGCPCQGNGLFHCCSRCKTAGQIRYTNAVVAVLADAIGEPVGVHPIDPALEDRRHGEPPERELQDQGVGP